MFKNNIALKIVARGAFAAKSATARYCPAPAYIIMLINTLKYAGKPELFIIKPKGIPIEI